jgi:hypothetical protein
MYPTLHPFLNRKHALPCLRTSGLFTSVIKYYSSHQPIRLLHDTIAAINTLDIGLSSVLSIAHLSPIGSPPPNLSLTAPNPATTKRLFQHPLFPSTTQGPPYMIPPELCQESEEACGSPPKIAQYAYPSNLRFTCFPSLTQRCAMYHQLRWH